MDSVVHFEIPFDDPKRAQKFYKDIFGWQINAAPGDMPYWLATTTEVDKQMMPKKPGAINGGFYKREKEGARTPVIVINVASVTDYVNKVKKAGGKIVFGKRQVGDMGFYAQVSDTEGNIIGLWETIQKQK